MTILNHFPTRLGSPRDQQVRAIEFVEKSTKRFVILELPTGAGKSGVAVTLCNAFGWSYVSTPTKNLMNQYAEDFNGDSVQLKGRINYPCTQHNPELNQQVIKFIKQGKSLTMPPKHQSCSAAPCIPLRNGKRAAFIEECEKESGKCPYAAMIEECQGHKLVIGNPYSLIYISYFGGHLSKRNLLVIDEAHETEKVIRSIANLNITINRVVAPKEYEHLVSPSDWLAWLKRGEQVGTFTKNEDKEKYLAKVEKLEKSEGAYGKKAIVKVFSDVDHGKFKVEFIPDFVGGLAQELFLSLGEKVVLLSGTIPDYKGFAAGLGIPLDDVEFMRIPSDFPAENRVVFLPTTDIDLSHKHWVKNLASACKEVNRILALHSNERGVIHTSSYSKAKQIADGCKNPRIIFHHNEDLQQKMKEFLKSPNGVLISPAISTGISLDDDLARFQVIMTPAYASIDDPLVKHRLDNGNWSWYNTQALIVLMQQCGRVVRSKTDHGVTYLVDSRFSQLLKKTWKLLPQWFIDGFR